MGPKVIRKERKVTFYIFKGKTEEDKYIILSNYNVRDAPRYFNGEFNEKYKREDLLYKDDILTPHFKMKSEESVLLQGFLFCMVKNPYLVPEELRLHYLKAWDFYNSPEFTEYLEGFGIRVNEWGIETFDVK